VNNDFAPLPRPERLHTVVTQTLARRVIQAEQNAEAIFFPKEADLCQQLGVSRTILRESMKVLVDKGMVEMKPRAGTRARPRSGWRLLDPDILAWQAEVCADGPFLRDLCEVRLAIEPTAAGFAAVRATPVEIRTIEESLGAREAKTGTAGAEEIIDLDLQFHIAVVAASHNPLLLELSSIIRQPFRVALAVTSRFRSTVELGLQAHHALLAALRKHDPMAARRAAEEVVGLAMLAVEKAIRSKNRRST
jgi:GntR family galactonate operon transcriptional repressor